jgi:hypothetical protein
LADCSPGPSVHLGVGVPNGYRAKVQHEIVGNCGVNGR